MNTTQALLALPKQRRVSRGVAAVALVLGAVVASFVYLSLGLGRLLSMEAVREMQRYAAEFFPPDVRPDFLAKIALGTLETLAISAVGTLLAAVAGALLALPASRRNGAPAQAATRLLLNALRSVPELVWAALMVLAAGLGPFAGALALALHTTGVLGRLFAEALENAPSAPEQALRDSGGGAFAAFLYGTLPWVWAQWLSYVLYRWEMNIRMAAILGFVGAGGLGSLLYYELSLLHQQQASTVILAMLLLVVVVDAASAVARHRLRPGGF